MKAYTLAEIAAKLELGLIGDGRREIHGVCPLSPGQADCLAFAGEPKYREAAAASQAAAVIVPEALAAVVAHGLIAPHPQLAFARAAALFAADERPEPGIHPSAVVDPSARLGEGLRIGAQCVIGPAAQIADGCALGAGCVIGKEVQIGADADIAAGVRIGDRVRIGARVLILPGAVIGSRGFGNVHDGRRWHAIPQLGTVVIGDDVEIGANTTIDRGALGDTEIGDNVRIDNLCQIAHNVKIGARTALASQVGIAGSTVIGSDCLLGGQVGVNGHIRIADRVIINGGSNVLQSVEQAGQYGSGAPLLPVMAWRRLMATLGRLDPRLKKLERGGRS